ncbi:amidohydrolase, partial [Francisella tularensis subsp. holarctica]|nr:amidohydrolase [Francisella tularensis subsp. holarctica]
PLFGRNNNLEEWQIFIKECSQNTNRNLKLSGFDLNNQMSIVKKALDFVFENISFHQLCYGSNFHVSNHYYYNFWQK